MRATVRFSKVILCKLANCTERCDVCREAILVLGFLLLGFAAFAQQGNQDLIRRTNGIDRYDSNRQMEENQQIEIVIDNPDIDPAKLELSIQGKRATYQDETQSWSIFIYANQIVLVNLTYPNYQQFSQAVFPGTATGSLLVLHLQLGPLGSSYLRKQNHFYPQMLNIENLAIARQPLGMDDGKFDKFLLDNGLEKVVEPATGIPRHANDSYDFVRVRRLDRQPMNNPEDRWIQKIVDAGYSPGLFLDEYFKQSYHYPLTIEFERGLSQQGLEQYLVENNLRFQSRFDNFITVAPALPLDFDALQFLISLQTNPNVISIDWTYIGRFSWD